MKNNSKFAHFQKPPLKSKYQNDSSNVFPKLQTTGARFIGLPNFIILYNIAMAISVTFVSFLFVSITVLSLLQYLCTLAILI